MPTPKAAPMYASRRREGVSARRAQAREAAASARRPVTQAQVKAIVMRNKEDKYMNVNVDTIVAPLGPTTGPKSLSVAAFATTATTQTGQVNPVQYCGRDIHNMHMLRPFNSSSTASALPNVIDGKEIMPTLAKSMFSIQRMSIDVGSSGNQAASDANVYKTCPIRCRIIRVTPKLQAGVTTAIDPTNDLFLNQVGVDYGPTNADFTMSDIESAVVNSRIYSVISDEKFTMEAAPAVVNTMRDYNLLYMPQVARPEGSFLKRKNYHHQLAARKGGTVHYDLPDAITTENATSGHRREYIFMHFWYTAADESSVTLTAAQEPPGGNTAGTPGNPASYQDVVIHLRTLSKFKDV